MLGGRLTWRPCWRHSGETVRVAQAARLFNGLRPNRCLRWSLSPMLTFVLGYCHRGRAGGLLVMSTGEPEARRSPLRRFCPAERPDRIDGLSRRHR